MANTKGRSDKPPPFSAPSGDGAQLRRISETTIAHYDRSAEGFWRGTRDHDVSQNHNALLEAIAGEPPFSILDLGCGPGRDLGHFRSMGHDAVGLDGSKEFVAMARSYAGCEVLHQDFLEMDLPEGRFDGVFANASLFHVPSKALPRVLRELFAALKPRGVLFCSNPRGNNDEGFSNGRYSCFFDLETWRDYVTAAGFAELHHYFRPAGLPRDRQPWLATVWRKD
jgi:SAM-dependent methyltransferase